MNNESNKRGKTKLNSTTFKNILKRIFTNPFYLISIFSIIFLVYTIGVPLYQMIANTFIEETSGNPTLGNWVEILTSEASVNTFYKPIYRSLGIGIFVSVIAMLIGGVIAWIVTRTDIPYKKTLTFMAVIPYMIPSWMKSLAWMTVFKNDRVGGAPGIIQSVFHITPPDWLSYGFVPIVIVLAGHYYVYFYLLTASALSSVDTNMEEVAGIFGAHRATILRKITFPLIMPAVLSGFILTFSKAIGSFGPAAFLGLPNNYYVLSTMLYNNMKTGESIEGYILSLVLIALAAITIYINQRVIGKRKGYETVGGKDGKKTMMSLGKWRKPTFVMVSLFMVSAALLPLILLALQSVMLKDGVYSLANFTTHFWIGESNPDIAVGEVGVLMNDAIGLALKNSLIIALIGAVAAAIFGIFFGYVIARRKSTTGKIVEQLAFLPYLVPGIALSAIYLTLFAKPFLIVPALYGTLSIIILITIVKELPFASRSGTSNMMQISSELEEAAAIQGASFFRRFFKILLPLTRQGMISAFLIAFISGMKELDLILLLVTPKTGTLTTLTFEYAETGYQQFANANMLIIIAITMLVYYIAVKWGKADLSKGIGG